MPSAPSRARREDKSFTSSNRPLISSSEIGRSLPVEFGQRAVSKSFCLCDKSFSSGPMTRHTCIRMPAAVAALSASLPLIS